MGNVNKPRIWGTVPVEVFEKIQYCSNKWGLPVTHVVSLAVQAGIGSLIRGISPEEALTPEQWAKIFESTKEIIGKEVTDVRDEVRNKGNIS